MIFSGRVVFFVISASSMLRPHTTASIQGSGRGGRHAGGGKGSAGAMMVAPKIRAPAPPSPYALPASPLSALQHAHRYALGGQRQGGVAARLLARASQLVRVPSHHHLSLLLMLNLGWQPPPPAPSALPSCIIDYFVCPCTTSLQQKQSQQGRRQVAVPDNFTFHFTCPYETAFGEVPAALPLLLEFKAATARGCPALASLLAHVCQGHVPQS